LIWYIGDDDIGKVGLTCDWAETGKFRAVELDKVIVLGMLIVKAF
jgi:hypothetical protein